MESNQSVYRIVNDASVLRQRLPMLDGPTLVLGSAPAPKIPIGFNDSWNLICVNGSGVVAKHLGLPVPTITLLSGAVFGQTVANREGRLALAGGQTGNLIYIDVCTNFDTASKELERLAYRYEAAFVLNGNEREYIIRCTSGQEVDSTCLPSNGVFACMLALF